MVEELTISRAYHREYRFQVEGDRFVFKLRVQVFAEDASAEVTILDESLRTACRIEQRLAFTGMISSPFSGSFDKFLNLCGGRYF